MINIRFFIPCLCAVLLSAGAWAQHAGAEGGNKFPLPGGDAGWIEEPHLFPLPGGEDSQGADDAPSMMPARGVLAIRAVQGTPGAEPIGQTKVTVQLYHRGMLLDTIETQLDEHGIVMLEDLPIDSAFQPVAQIEYAGVTYSVVGELMEFKGYKGEFVKRRLQGFLRACAKRGWHHDDDLSMGAVHLG